MAKYAQSINLASTVSTVLGKTSDAKQVVNLAKTQQAYNEVAAKQAVAASQRTMLEERRRATLLASRALAVAGGSASDPTVMRIIADIEEEGAYRANVALYGGQEKARILEAEGDLAVYKSKVKASNLREDAFTSALKGGASFYSKKYMGTGKA